MHVALGLVYNFKSSENSRAKNFHHEPIQREKGGKENFCSYIYLEIIKARTTEVVKMINTFKLLIQQN